MEEYQRHLFFNLDRAGEVDKTPGSVSLSMVDLNAPPRSLPNSPKPSPIRDLRDALKKTAKLPASFTQGAVLLLPSAPPILLLTLITVLVPYCLRLGILNNTAVR